MSSAIENETNCLKQRGLPIHALDKIVKMASEILGPNDEFLEPGFLESSLADVLIPLSLPDRCERALQVPSLTKEMLNRLYEREPRPMWEQLDYIFGDFEALAVCFPKYWDRDGVPQELKKNLARLVLMHQKVIGRIN